MCVCVCVCVCACVAYASIPLLVWVDFNRYLLTRPSQANCHVVRLMIYHQFPGKLACLP